MEDFYKGFAQRARELAEKADPFTRRRLLDLAGRYDAKSKRGGSTNGRPLPPTRPTSCSTAFSSSNEA